MAIPFDSEKARLAGILSGAARRARNSKTVAEQALEDLIALKGMLYSIMTTAKCQVCGREGPKISEQIDVIKTLLSVNSEVMNRLKGKPPTESTAQRYGSVDEYQKAARSLEPDANTYEPELPPPPEE